MGQSNSTSPLQRIQPFQKIKDFNYSRLITIQNQISSCNLKVNNYFKFKIMTSEYFKLSQFSCLNPDEILEKSNRSSQANQQNGSYKNISNSKLAMQIEPFSVIKSRMPLTSNLQSLQNQSLAPQLQGNQLYQDTFQESDQVVSNCCIIQKVFNEITKKFDTKVTNYFQQQQQMQNYVSNLVKLKQLLNTIKLFQNFFISEQDGIYAIERIYSGEIGIIKGRICKKMLQQNLKLLLDYLFFLAIIYLKLDNIYVDPQDVFIDNNEFYLLDFKYKEIKPFQMIQATLEWIFKRQFDHSKIIQQKMFNSNHYLKKSQKTLEQCLHLKEKMENYSFPPYIRELWRNMTEKRIERNQLLEYISRLRIKALTLSMKTDSFHACIQHKKTSVFQQEKHAWILGKKFNEIYFYNIDDDHSCQVKLIRKNKKIDLSQIKMVFDSEELQLKYIAQNSKFIIQVSQFELQKSSCLSDIQIKYRLPIKFKSPHIFFDDKNQQIFILENCVYKFSITENKIFQLTKKILDCAFLARSHDYGFMVIKLSIDIFKKGIRIFLNQADISLAFVGQANLLDEVSNIRVDVRTVDFCKEIHKGVYVMFANKNFWILDTNFYVFYSFATIERIKKFYGFASVNNNSNNSKPGNFSHNHHRQHELINCSNAPTNYAFEIFNQPFGVEFLTQQEGLNLKIKDDQLHIIGQIQGSMYYLNYLFMPEVGSLKLKKYKPLLGIDSKMNQTEECKTILIKNSQQHKTKLKSKKVTIIEQQNRPLSQPQPNNLLNKNTHNQSSPLQIKALNKHQPIYKQANKNSMIKFLNSTTLDAENYQFYLFNFHEQNLECYKNQQWIFFYEPLFIKIQDFYLKTNKTNYQIQLKIKKTKCSVKDLIQKMKKINEKNSSKDKKIFSKEEILFYMLRCLQIFEWLVKNDFYHRNFSINNLHFMQENNVLKLIGWSESPRNWYVSDYKDLLLVFFNIITCNSFEKLNQKMLYKYKMELDQFPVVLQKMQTAFKHMKVSEKKSQIQKEIKQIRESLLKQFTQRFLLGEYEYRQSRISSPSNQLSQNVKEQIQRLNSNQFIFNFEYNTPRFALISINKKKMKKMKCLIDENSKQELIFKSSDKYLWNQQKESLYMFTNTYQFYELKINTQSFKEQTLICEQYEYLPNNILESTFIYVPIYGILSFGGIYKAKDSQLTFNRIVYQFNFLKLTWDALFQIPEPRVNPYLVVSLDESELYCMGGHISHSLGRMNILKIKLSKESSEDKPKFAQLLVDPLGHNPFNEISSAYPSKIYNISTELQLFLLFFITPQKYFIRIFSLNSFCLDFQLENKNYFDDSKLISSAVGISLSKETIHVLRQYGKYALIHFNKLEGIIVTNETIYPEREQIINQ